MAGGRTISGGLVAGLVSLLLLAGCQGEHSQSMLYPAGGEAGEIARIWWSMFGLLSAVFIAVMVFTGWAVLARKQKRPSPPGGGVRFIVVAGIVFPALILVALLFYSLAAGGALRLPDRGLVIEVTGHQWWWDVRYPEERIITANEIYVPAGEPVRIVLRSGDVIHSFWAPNLHGKMDAIPGVSNQFWIHADEPGRWRGQCAEFCGRQHALMAFWVIALAPEEFRAWVEERQQASPVEEEPRLARGREAFFRASCNECHTIRGTEADGVAGPNLTHIGSRLTLGAGTLPNTTANLMGWVVNPQEIKPGNQMPRTFLEPEELHALAEYLQSLE